MISIPERLYTNKKGNHQHTDQAFHVQGNLTIFVLSLKSIIDFIFTLLLNRYSKRLDVLPVYQLPSFERFTLNAAEI